jgi:GT2 family glycosyltransferase
MPVAGPVWQTLHYLLGLELLGFEAYYVEAHACAPTMLMRHPDDTGSASAAAFIAAIMHRFGFDGRWAYHALHHDGRCYGMSHRELLHVYASAACLFNLHGGTEPLDEHRATGRLVYIETDPVRLQVELAQMHQPAIDMLEAHCAYFSYAENWGRPGCSLPSQQQFDFLPTRQPVIVDLWAAPHMRPGPMFTTIANWDQRTRDITIDGKVLSWSKRQEFLKFVDLPQRSQRRFELALSKADADRDALEAHGWAVRPADDVSTSIDRYRGYIRGSRGEFTVAKEQNVAFRSGWFSDRSATYLAAHRPVVTQDTGLEGILPVGEGLFTFSTYEEILAALQVIDTDYSRQCRAAGQIARAYFDYNEVLTSLLDRVGLSSSRRFRPFATDRLDTGRAADPAAACIPVDLVITPIAKHPLTFAPDTATRILDAPVPVVRRSAAVEHPTASIVVVVFDQLPLTRLCLESILLNTRQPAYEIIVVDNGSGADTFRYLQDLAHRNPVVRPLRNDRNEGFPRAVNCGLEAAVAETLVILNSDTIVTPGWLSGLAAHLEDSTVGVVGPVTNEAANECRIPAAYDTYGQLLAFSAQRPRDARTRDVAMLTMFCVSLRRDVYSTVGPLDERFGIGLFEDDDYAMRVHAAGFRCVCAEDVFVHHFGRGSLGALVPTGEYGRLLRHNRALFEAKWNVEWAPHAAPPDDAYEELIDRLRSKLSAMLSSDSRVAVASRGDDRLVELAGLHVSHFPHGPNGAYAGHYPANDDEAVRLVEAVRLDGYSHLVFPAPAAWWLHHYPGVSRYLQRHADMAFHENDTGTIYRLHPRDPRPDPAEIGATTSPHQQGAYR